MGYINQNIDDDIDIQFREIAFRKYGMKKGSMLKCLEEAIELWSQTNEERMSAEEKTSKLGKTRIKNKRSI